MSVFELATSKVGGFFRDAPTPEPTSRVLRALMERSGLTLPMIWAALPLARCESWKNVSDDGDDDCLYRDLRG